MNSVVNLKDGFITFNSNIDHSLSFSKCAIGYSNYNVNSHERGSLVFLTNNNANIENISMNDIRMCIASDGNVGIGTNNPVNKLDVNGSINIPAGSKYKINNYNLAFSNIDGPLPTAGIGTSGTLGGVKVDGSTITINNNIISATAQVNSDWNEISTASKAFILNKPTITSSQWITSGTIIHYNAGNVGIGTNAEIQSKLTINGINTELANSVNHSEAPLTITNPTATSTSVLNDPKAVLNLCRTGTSGQAYSARACFKLCRFENSSTNSRTRLDITLAHKTYDDLNIMSLQSGGNVGIGTTNPNFKLHLHKTATEQDVRIQLTDDTTTTSLARGVQIIKGTDNHGYLYNYEENKDLILGTNATERIRILANGNVGVGTTNPQRPLHVQTAMRIGGSGACIDFGDDMKNQIYRTTTLNELVFTTNAIDRLIIDGGGTVKTSGGLTVGSDLFIESSRLVIRGASPTIYLKDTNERSGMIHMNANVMYFLNASGADSETWLQQNGQDWCLQLNMNTNLATFGGILQVNGDIRSNGNITAYYSDERLKTITEYVSDVLPTLSKIRVFRYNCNDLAASYGYDKNKKEIGLSAQEIQKYYPEVVSIAPFDAKYDEETKELISKSGEKYLTLDYERLVPILLQGIKDLNNIVEKMQENEKNMKNEINNIKLRLEKLEV